MHVLSPSVDRALDVFTRFDYADTQAKVLGGLAALREFDRKSLMYGVTFHPIPQVALKLDYRRHRLGAGDSFNEFASAITWLF